MKTCTYKWIIGCLTGVIVILIAFLISKEVGIITVSFSECLSLAATLSSIILSVVAMFYTFFSGRDTMKISTQIQSAIKEINTKVAQVSEEAKTNSETLVRMKDAMKDVEMAFQATSQALATFQQEQITEQEREIVIKNIQSTKNSMMMFLEKMKHEV